MRLSKVGMKEWVPYESVSDAARRLGLNPGHVSSTLRGRQCKTGGFEFQWAVPNEPECLPGEVWKEVF